MKQGDFSLLAKDYINRPGYSDLVLSVLTRAIGVDKSSSVADVGAGTGKLTEQLYPLCGSLSAVEPNEDMRAEGIRLTPDAINWQEGSAEKNDLEDDSYDWLTMASSFHWTNPEVSLPRFARALRSSGALTIIWNPRNIGISEFHMEIEEEIKRFIPDLKRVSSGASHNTKNWNEILVSTGHFEKVFFVEAEHEEHMTPDRYLGAWRSVNDIQAQAGPERWKAILDYIESKVSDLETVVVPYKTRAWTCFRK